MQYPLNESQYRLLCPTVEVTPTVYCTTKIHKSDNPIRPIVDYTGSIGYQTSKSLADMLAPVAEEDGKCICGGELHIQFPRCGVSFFIFTNTPIEKSLDIIKDKLETYSSLSNRTKVSADASLCQHITTTLFQL